MKIRALQKLTLLDFPGKTAATVFTCGCNLRCPFCHNASLVVGEKGRNTDGSDYSFDEEPLVDEEEIFSLLDRRKGLLDGIAITGGEPLLQKDIGEFIAKIKAKGFAVKLDTNGFLPERLKTLLDRNLVDYVAMDFKQSPEKYGEAAGIPGIDFEPFRKSINYIKVSGVDHEFRTTIVKGIHTKEDVAKIAAEIGPGSKYFLQMFVDSGDVLANRSDSGPQLEAFTPEEAREILDAARAFIPETAVRGM
ncbi:MAG: anaerobic ribonucleoside-triphosphate reductase activating protein [Clostridia bacterium]|nr:anaerobic ribonucleoside-triphosphate reductase activating protein [Clostridia bacterium]